MTRTQDRGLRALAAVLLAVAMAFAAWGMAPAPAQAREKVPAGTSCSLTVTGCPANGQVLRLYRVASMDSNGKLTAVDALAQAVSDTKIDPAKFDSSTTADDLATAAKTYQGYMAGDPDAFDEKTEAVEAGTATFGKLEPGMYLLCADVATVGEWTYTAVPNLVIVPQLDEWTYNTQCKVVGKFERTHATSYHNRVTKLWKGDTASARPKSVTVRIYDGTTLYKEVTLSASNNWSFAWDGKGSWSVREVGVPAGYTCSTNMTQAAATSTAQGCDFTITNTKPGGGGGSHSGSGKTTSGGSNLPRTGDVISYALAAALLCGGVALVYGSLRGRKQEARR